MSSVKVKFRPSTVAGKEGSLFYQIIHERRLYRIPTGCKLLPEEWDTQHGSCRIDPHLEAGRRSYLAALQQRIDSDADRLRRILAMLEQSGRRYTFAQIESMYAAESGTTLFGFMEQLIAQLARQNRIRTSETYTAALRSFSRFLGMRDICFDAINSDLMEAYEADLLRCGVCKNTSSFYMRILRAVYNRAVEKDLTPQRKPFRHVYTGIDKTIKRAIPIDAVRRLLKLDLASHPSMDYARDMFLLSFYMRGMSFVDMAYLKNTDLRNGVLTYRRRKTGQLLCIRWEPCMQAIVDKYPPRHPDYLLPILRSEGPAGRNQYKNVGYLINRNLKLLGRQLQLSIPLTLYVARHTWASIARSRNIPLSVISQGMGHDSEMTTRIYLSSLDTAVVDHANLMVINSLSEGVICG